MAAAIALLRLLQLLLLFLLVCYCSCYVLILHLGSCSTPLLPILPVSTRTTTSTAICNLEIDLNYVVDQNRRPQNDDNSSDKTSAMSTTDEILQEKKCIRLRLWQVFFANPYEWWDNRQSKPHFKCADFKHKDTGEKLWLLPDDPPWIRRQLELHDQEIAKNGHRDGRRTLKNDTWESRDFDSSPSQDLYSSDDDGLLHSSGV
uniref:Uncharacterized protein n=1 Tax=Oryza brachyantha TaxID=4533 RepID=J3LQS8_ORYBR